MVSPAREVELRGPSLRGAQNERNAAFEGALEAVTERSEKTAAGDYALALEQERKAAIREDAANQTAAERAEDMAQRQADFDQSVKAMGEAGHVDPTRFWSDAGAGQKIAMMASLLLGGLAQAKGAASNAGVDTIRMLRDQDIKAQEFAYHATRDAANAKQTAFSMAMQKYNNVDQARAAARAAANDAISAQLAQQAALWKNTESANRAQMAIADLANERMMQIQQGIQYRQPTVSGGSWVDPRTGMIYNDQEAKGLVAKMDEREFSRESKATDITGNLMVEGAKANTKAAADMRGEMVALPNGDTVRAPSGPEGASLRKAVASTHETHSLVAEAKKIRESDTWRASPSARGRLAQIQARLKVQFKNQAELGALSGDDHKLAEDATADLFAIGSGTDARLDGINETADRNIRNTVKTYPDAPGTAKGQPPASFTPHGKK